MVLKPHSLVFLSKEAINISQISNSEEYKCKICFTVLFIIEIKRRRVVWVNRENYLSSRDKKNKNKTKEKLIYFFQGHQKTQKGFNVGHVPQLEMQLLHHCCTIRPSKKKIEIKNHTEITEDLILVNKPLSRFEPTESWRTNIIMFDLYKQKWSQFIFVKT